MFYARSRQTDRQRQREAGSESLRITASNSVIVEKVKAGAPAFIDLHLCIQMYDGLTEYFALSQMRDLSQQIRLIADKL